MQRTTTTTREPTTSGGFWLTIGVALAVLFFIVSGLIDYRNARKVHADTTDVTGTHDVLFGLSQVLGLLRDAESGQRGFVIAGDEAYLEPYNEAIAKIGGRLATLEELAADRPQLLERIKEARNAISLRLAEFGNVIAIRRASGARAATDRMQEHVGTREMEDLRASVRQMEIEAQERRRDMMSEMQSSFRDSIASNAIGSAAGILLSLATAFFLYRAAEARARQQWLQQGQILLADATSGDQESDELGANVLARLAEYTGAQAGVFYVASDTGFERVASYGVPADAPVPARIAPGDGLLGQAAADKRPFFLDPAPDGYLRIGSAFGQAAPRCLAISPAVAEKRAQAVYELGYLKKPHGKVSELLAAASDLIGVSVRAARYRSELRALLEETQRQAEQLQSQSEELRVSNEELEEQGRALRESAARLEQQQAELEQSNAQLEEQTQQLETHRDELTRAQRELRARSVELERASQYKSDFLANMSHELRTPLNSSLILAKLLADNPRGNLTEEQVEFARTIESSGNDLLVLINDILDLSKIEAGHMELHPESVPIEWLAKDLTSVFAPIGNAKGVPFDIEIDPSAPMTIETDRQRLDQILKNLLSNAFKFTESGEVKLSVSAGGDGEVSFAVSDTGIGISEEKQAAIFDAFAQADGTISRKYGGTGLGLAISRQLARLLGGSIGLRSEPGAGSTFTLALPAVFDPAAAKAEDWPRSAPPAPQTQPAEKPVERPAALARPRPVADDRDTLTDGERSLLVVEDDEPFAKILYDVARQLGFKCLVAGTADEALSICRRYLPSAVVLDVGLPDNSGLSVLDRLKRDAKTRHIPVHVVSANDHEQTALSLGAVGHMLKPVKRSELEDAIRGMESRLDSRLRRVLIVEDDATQRQSVMSLLNTRDVETVAVGTAAECLDKLKEETFDCMILDLALPDSSGFALLERLSEGEEHSYPPVIVYTGRDLSGEEEQRLRHYSKSIIIKGAKSPERLLDEVTLFLHQVVSDLPAEKQRMLEKARHRDSILEGRRILVVEDDIRNVYAVTNIFEPLGAQIQIARNGREAIEALEAASGDPEKAISLVLMDVMMPEMDGLAATREIRKRPEWRKLPIIMLTAKAMRGDQQRCLDAGADDYMAKPIDVEKLVSLVRVWMPR